MLKTSDRKRPISSLIPAISLIFLYYSILSLVVPNKVASSILKILNPCEFYQFINGARFMDFSSTDTTPNDYKWAFSASLRTLSAEVMGGSVA